jgi:hypothetical protein
MRKLILISGCLFIFTACSQDAPIEESVEDAVVEEAIDVSIEVSAAVVEDEVVEEEVVMEARPSGIVSTVINPGTRECEVIYSDASGEAYDLSIRAFCNTAMRRAVSPDGRFLIYVDFPNIMLFDSVEETRVKLMSVLNDTDGVDFYWSPDSRKIAMSVVNQDNDSYSGTAGTKLYILGINEVSELIQKDRHLFKMRYECHDAGCNVEEDDLYFLDNSTLMYRTWNDDPYSAAGDVSLLRTVENL